MGACLTNKHREKKYEDDKAKENPANNEIYKEDSAGYVKCEVNLEKKNTLPSNEQVVDEKPLEYPTKEEIEELNQVFNDNGVECPICLEKYTEITEKKTILCGHCYCLICITKTLQILPLCPLCRREINFHKEFNITSKEGEDKEAKSEDKETSTVSPPTTTTNNWNVHTVRNIFSNDNFFNRGNDKFFANRFGNNRTFKQAGMLSQNDPFLRKNSFHELLNQRCDKMLSEPFFVNAKKNFENRKNEVNWGSNKADPFDAPLFKKKNHFNDPFFKKDQFNDPFFKKDHFNDPFFKKDHFKDPFFKKDNLGSGFGASSNFGGGFGASSNFGGGFKGTSNFGGGFGGRSNFGGGFGGGFK